MINIDHDQTTDHLIACEHIEMKFGSHKVVDDLNLRIKRGEFISLLGPSGSGKTTILMLIAGFLRPTAGTISVGGRRIDGLPPHSRDMGVVFQNYALFPHMSVADNIAFPLKMRRTGRSETDERVARALDMVQLSHVANRRPAGLSGGQQQRIALARALVFEPAVVLMDEPLGALDKQLRERMQLDIRDLHRRLGLTIVFVTHDQSEALTMSDRIAVFNRGKIDQIGSPNDIYDRPASRFVAEFIGETNLLPATLEHADSSSTTLRLENGSALRAAPMSQKPASTKVSVSVRPECIMVGPVSEKTETPRENMLAATITDSVYHGDHLRLLLNCGGHSMVARQDRGSVELPVGSSVNVTFRPSDCLVVPE